MNQDAFDMLLNGTLDNIDAMYRGAGFENYGNAAELASKLMQASRRLEQIAESVKTANIMGAMG